MTFQGLFKDQNKNFQGKIQFGNWYSYGACMNKQEAKNTKNETFLGIL